MWNIANHSSTAVRGEKLVRNALTDQTLKALRPPETGYRIEWDGLLRGFGCRISQAGTRAFVVLIARGRPHTIGRYPTMTLADARREAKKLLAEKTLGRAKPTRSAFEDCRDEYLRECATRLRPGTHKLYTYHLTRDFPFGRQAIADITPRQILKELQRCTPSMREHAARIGRTFFLWAIRNHYLDVSPMARFALPPKGKSRERALTDGEIVALLRACQRTAGPYAAIIEILLRTGQRRAQVAGLKRDWVDAAEKTITFPAESMKGDRPHVIPITDTTLALIKSQPELTEYVFPAMRERVRGKPATCFAGFSKAKKTLDQECGFTNWVLHDTRRTHAVLLQKLHIRFEVIEAILGHVIPGVAGVYQRYDWMPEMRDAEEKLDAYLKGLIEARN